MLEKASRIQRACCENPRECQTSYLLDSETTFPHPRLERDFDQLGTRARLFVSDDTSQPCAAGRDVLRALNQAIAAADPERILNEKVRPEGRKLSVDSVILDLSKFKRILAIGGGKASASMSAEIERIGNRVDGLRSKHSELSEG
jgi:hypothetical protein